MSEFILEDVNSELPDFTVDYDLSGINYRLRCIWNERDQGWSIDISLAVDNTPLVTGRRISTNVDLFGKYTDSRLPGGILYCIDTQKDTQDIDPNRYSLGDRHILIYNDLQE